MELSYPKSSAYRLELPSDTLSGDSALSLSSSNVAHDCVGQIVLQMTDDKLVVWQRFLYRNALERVPEQQAQHYFRGFGLGIFVMAGTLYREKL